jgi:hypothetical protein
MRWWRAGDASGGKQVVPGEAFRGEVVIKRKKRDWLKYSE